MNKLAQGLFAIAIISLIYGCTKQAQESDTVGGKFTRLVETADSLVDIKPDSALILCRQFFEEYPGRTDSLYARARLVEGNAYFAIGDMDEAISSMGEAKRVAEASGDKYALINATSDLGVMMRVSQKPDSALSLYNEALSLIGSGPYKDEKAHLLTSIAVLYANTGHLEEARDYADKAVEAANDSEDMDLIMYASSQAGAIYNLLGDREKGLQLTRLAAATARQNNLPRYELKALDHLIDLHLRAGQTDSVLHYLRRGETLSQLFPVNSVEGLGFLEEKYVVLAALGRHKESIAVQRYLLGLQNAAAFMPVDKLWLRMARNYDALHRADSAAICYERAFELIDSIRGEETDRQLGEFYVRFKTSEKELALANMERQKAQTDMWLSIWIAVAVAVISGSALYIRSRKKSERMRILQSRLEGIEQERGRLAQDLHDGVCNDLYGIELLLQSPTPKEQLLGDVEQIRADVRRISHELMPPSLQDVTLLQAFEDMVGKLQHSYPDKHISLTAQPESGWEAVPQHKSYALYRICQELLGNIVRHANPTEVSVELALGNATVGIVIKNDATTSCQKAGHGIGLESVKERLASIGATAEGLPFGRKIAISCSIK